jgi:acyl carrier protein
MAPLEPLSFEAFQQLLASLLEVDAAQLTPQAYFVADLGVDSIGLLHLLLRLEKLGFELPLASVWQIQTVEDAYHYYQQQARQFDR